MVSAEYIYTVMHIYIKQQRKREHQFESKLALGLEGILGKDHEENSIIFYLFKM